MDFFSNTDKLLLDGVLGGGDQHLLLDLSGVWGPDNKEDLAALTTIIRLERQIVDGITAIVLGKFSNEGSVVGFVGGLLNNHFLEVVRDTKKSVLVLVAHLDLVVDIDNFISNLDSRHVCVCWCVVSKPKKKATKKRECGDEDALNPLLGLFKRTNQILPCHCISNSKKTAKRFLIPSLPG